jgi:alanine racemase
MDQKNPKKTSDQARAKLERLLQTKMEDDPSSFDRIRAVRDARALINNYQAIQDQIPNQSILPMIKANAYGHGATWAARQLLTMPALYGFGLATLNEAKDLRKELGAAGKRVKLIVFSGTTPWSDDKGRFCEKYGITPVIATDTDWQAFFQGGWTERLSYELKFNTGLNRLGISLNLAPTLARTLRNRPAVEHPAGIFSHLVMSETPDTKMSLTQKDKFIWLRRELGEALPSTQFHLGNSAAIWNHKLWGLKDLTDVVRPGIALYGIPPWKGAPARGLKPVLTLEAEVVHRHRLKVGESVGYGATFKVKGDETVQVATLSAGYADGINRMLSSRGFVWLKGRKSRVLGRVSMDLCAVECPSDAQVGDWAEFLGPHIDPWEQAEAAQTIPYELLTSISSRVQRVDG